MIKSVLTNEILKRISTIEENRFRVSTVVLPSAISNKLRKNSKKKSSYTSNKIEGNPLSEKQADEVIEADSHRHFLKPEQEIRNYYSALSYLEKKLENKEGVSTRLIMDIQAMVKKGAPKEKIGIRGPMPPGVLFAVYNTETGNADYIPPENVDIPALLEELIHYINTTDDHPLIIAAIVHYQLVTIHPFEDGNGRTARLISGYILDYYGYGFQGIGSLEEYFAYDLDEYYSSLQMGLPALYYAGRNNPPHPEIWINYFLRMVELYSQRVYDISTEAKEKNVQASISHLNTKERKLLSHLLRAEINEYTPIELGLSLHVTNRTIINWSASLVKTGFVIPVLVKERIRSYVVSDYTRENREEILSVI